MVYVKGEFPGKHKIKRDQEGPCRNCKDLAASCVQEGRPEIEWSANHDLHCLLLHRATLCMLHMGIDKDRKVGQGSIGL